MRKLIHLLAKTLCVITALLSSGLVANDDATDEYWNQVFTGELFVDSFNGAPSTLDPAYRLYLFDNSHAKIGYMSQNPPLTNNRERYFSCPKKLESIKVKIGATVYQLPLQKNVTDYSAQQITIKHPMQIPVNDQIPVTDQQIISAKINLYFKANPAPINPTLQPSSTGEQSPSLQPPYSRIKTTLWASGGALAGAALSLAGILIGRMILETRALNKKTNDARLPSEKKRSIAFKRALRWIKKNAFKVTIPVVTGSALLVGSIAGGMAHNKQKSINAWVVPPPPTPTPTPLAWVVAPPPQD